MKSFTGKRYVVTGGSRGIGRAIAATLLAQGAQVCITARRASTLRETADSFRAGASCLPRVCDSLNPSELQALADELASRWGGIDGLVVNAAGGAVFKPVSALANEEMTNCVHGNFVAPALTMKTFLPLLQPASSILAIGSIAASHPTPGVSLYSASKAALRSFVQTLARELGPHGIRVNMLSPGPIDTETFGRDFGLDEEALAGLKKSLAAPAPLGRMGLPQEVAHVAAFMLSENASFVTGVDWAVDGGRSLATLG